MISKITTLYYALFDKFTRRNYLGIIEYNAQNISNASELLNKCVAENFTKGLIRIICRDYQG